MRNSSTLLSVHDLRSFGYHLEQAVHDARHSRDGQEIVHFWDDDAVFYPTFGFEELKKRSYYPRTHEPATKSRQGRDASQEDLVIQALFAAGFLGPVSLLPPHLAEYFAVVERKSQQRPNRSFSDRFAQFFDERPEELAAFEALAEAIAPVDRDPNAEGIARAVRMIRELDPWTFVLMENTASPWPRRFRRLMGDSRLLSTQRVITPTSEEVLSSHHFTDVQEGLERATGAPRSISTAIDAAALTYLILLNRPDDGADGRLYPRFYTSSPRIRRLYSNEKWFRDLLSFEVDRDNARRRTGTVWRDAYYYRIRAVFPALRPLCTQSPNSRKADGGAARGSGGVDLAQLADLSHQINRAIIRGTDEMAKLLETHKLPDDRPLREVISSLSDMGMAEVWMASDPEDYALRWRRGLQEILEVSSLELTQAFIDEEYRALGAATKDRVRTYALQLKLMTTIARHLDFSRTGKSADDTAAIKNLGVARWGVEWVGEYPFSNVDSPAGARNLLRWSNPDRYSDRVAELSYLVALLLSIDEFDLALKLLSHSHNTTTPGLQVMRWASQIRQSPYLSDETLRSVMSEVFSFWQEVEKEPELALRLTLGVGYVALHAWRKSSAAIMATSQPMDPEGWAAFARDIVLRQIPHLDRERLILAINHVVYVEALAGLQGAHSMSLVAALRLHAGETGLYRLYDTVGWREYLLLLREGSLDKPESRERLEGCVKDLELAYRHSYRDDEVTQHLRLAKEALAHLE